MRGKGLHKHIYASPSGIPQAKHDTSLQIETKQANRWSKRSGGWFHPQT